MHLFASLFGITLAFADCSVADGAPVAKATAVVYGRIGREFATSAGVAVEQRGRVVTVLTVAHVVSIPQPLGSLRVQFYDGTYGTRIIDVRVLVEDAAVIRVEVPDSYRASLACLGPFPEQGYPVFAIGHGTQTYYRSALGRTRDGDDRHPDWLLMQCDECDRGFSGGPVVAAGRVVGVIDGTYRTVSGIPTPYVIAVSALRALAALR